MDAIGAVTRQCDDEGGKHPANRDELTAAPLEASQARGVGILTPIRQAVQELIAAAPRSVVIDDESVEESLPEDSGRVVVRMCSYGSVAAHLLREWDEPFAYQASCWAWSSRPAVTPLVVVA
jgi:hypothetical protein